MQFFDISLNLITLFALVLAIGSSSMIIVVIEAVHAKMEEHLSPLKATKSDA
jgi:HAE1 family hydrophobic/amphiphilic exporter-1